MIALHTYCTLPSSWHPLRQDEAILFLLLLFFWRCPWAQRLLETTISRFSLHIILEERSPRRFNGVCFSTNEHPIFARARWFFSRSPVFIYVFSLRSVLGSLVLTPLIVLLSSSTLFSLDKRLGQIFYFPRHGVIIVRSSISCNLYDTFFFTLHQSFKSAIYSST